jgi:hypothetical protein
MPLSKYCQVQIRAILMQFKINRFTIANFHQNQNLYEIVIMSDTNLNNLKEKEERLPKITKVFKISTLIIMNNIKIIGSTINL